MKRRAAIITACLLGLALIAADIYVAVAPEYQLAKPSTPQRVTRAAAPAISTPQPERVAPPTIDPAQAAPNRKPAAPRPALKLAGKSAPVSTDADSPIAIAAMLSGETSGVGAATTKPGSVNELQGFDTVVALGVFGSGGGAPPDVDPLPPDGTDQPGDTDNPPGGTANPPDDASDPPGPGPGDGLDPPVLETPIPSAFFLFGAGLAGMFLSRRRRRA